MFIAGITLFTRAAIEGGVPEETAYSLSDGYIQTVEECMDRESIEKLSRKAAERFAREVKKYGNPHYSSAIDRAVRYIHLHLHTGGSESGCRNQRLLSFQNVPQGNGDIYCELYPEGTD
jgi:hypothetical protein